MNTRLLRFFCLLVAAVLSESALAQTDNAFAKGNQEYAGGHYKEAVDAYEQSVRAGQWSANLFYDLGNAYFHAGDLGRAILNYERALQLDHHHPEAQANLRIARDEARAIEIVPTRAERMVEYSDTNNYAVIAAVAFWVATFCLVAWFFSRRRIPSALAVGIISLIVCALAIAAVLIIQNGANGRGFAIVTGSNVNARLATADNAQTVLTLPAGSEIKVLSKRSDWIYAALPNDLRGWIPAKDVESVRL